MTPAPAEDGPLGAKRTALFALLALALVLLVFGRTLGNAFVFDDHKLVETNPVVRTLDPLTHLGTPFWSRWEMGSEYWRPAVTWSLALDRALWGESPRGFHLTNLLLHAAAVLLLFLVLRRLGGTAPAAAGALLFAVHPVHVESVAFVLGRTDLLATTFLLLAAWCYARLPDRAERASAPWLAGSLGALALALGSKESAVTFPALALGIDLARARGATWRVALAQRVPPFLRKVWPYLLLVLVYVFVRWSVIGAVLGTSDAPEVSWRNPLAAAPLATRLMTAVDVARRYAALALFPASLSVEYGHAVVPPIESPTSPAFLFSLVVVALLIAATALLARHGPLGRFGAAAAAGTYLLMSHLLFPAPILMAERVMYLPMVGLAALAAATLAGAVRRLVRAPNRARAVIALAALLALPLAARSFVRVGDWRDDLTLFESATRATPDAALAWNNLGAERTRRGDFEGALRALDRAIEIYPGYVSARVNRAVALRDRGDLESAERELRDTLRRFPESDDVGVMLVTLLGMRAEELAQQGRDEEQRELRAEAAALGTRLADAKASRGAPGVEASLRMTAGQNLALLGRDEEAQAQFDRAVAAAEREIAEGVSVPEVDYALQAGVLGAAAWFQERRGRHADAAARYLEASAAAERANDPALAATMQLEAARAWLAAGRAEEAAQATARATELAPAEATPGSRLGEGRVAVAEGLLGAGRPEQAAALYDAVLAADPDHVRARHGRARARLAIRDLAGAEQDLRRLAGGSHPPRLTAAIWNDLAAVALTRGDTAEALARLDRALEAEPAFLESRFRRGLLRAQTGDVDGAENDLEQALAAGLPPGAAAEAWYRLATIADGRGDRGAARQRVRRSLEIDPAHAGAQALGRRLGG